ncbi:MAG: phosphoglycerate mutase family protein [Bacteroidetes bacterium]|jgi:broad specificity phosphatase PhoE|nr:phosphoglycerate mutase family protein [Bacteroidota bacterium]NBY29338.1 histidine phosphatase family protein [Sphingobacteriia bacterium]NDC71996.1 histidine phosphatase family protein [Sphingobacteriia bacterium]
MSQLLYLLRHGQTDFNLQDKVQGSGHDTSLNDTGKAQALAFHRHYAGEPFDAFYCSALQRSRQTLEPFLQDPFYQGIKLHERSGLNEFNWGIFEGNSFDAFDEVYRQLVVDWKAGKEDAAPPGGDSPAMVAARMQPVVDELRQGSFQRPLICLHGRALRLLLCLLTGKPSSAMDDFDHSNLCLYVMLRVGDFYDVVQANDTTHLQGLQSGHARR